MSETVTPNPETVKITPDNIATYMEIGRTNYITELEKKITICAEELDKTLSGLLLHMRNELDSGSKELALGRELFFLVSTQGLTPERWQSLVARKVALQGKETAATNENKSS